MAVLLAGLFVGCASARMDAPEPVEPRPGTEPIAAPAAADADPRLQSLRNLGKAMYENPATQYDAVDVLREAWELSGEARDRVNHGLALLRAGREEEGLAELAAAQGEAPEIPHTWFNLGLAAEKAGRYEEARRQLEGLLERVPGEPVALYHLGVLARLAGDLPRAIERFEAAAAPRSRGPPP
ncbi:MAG TPA: tetratricopeptide repeat protein, partial [Thermoanaerobaculia bacterium]|nr:tetratricopeptide repeat protein [Thermoanaerobaculia bacterium]